MNRRAAASRAVPFGRLVIVLQAVVAVAFVGYLFAGDRVDLPLSGSGYRFEVALADAAGVDERTANPVLINGVRAGEVVDVRYRRGEAVAEVELEDWARGHLRRDARAEVVPRSALQDQMLDLDPGTASQPLADGALIPRQRASSPVALDRLIETLDADTRAQVMILVDELRTGLEGRSGALADDLRRLGTAMKPTARVADALADRRRLLADLVGELDVIFTTLARHERAVGDVVTAGRRTLETTTRRDADLAATMRRLPGTLAAVGDALDEVGALARPLEPALERLRPAARRLPAGLAALRRLVPAAQGFVDDLAPLVRDGRGPVRNLRGTLEALRPAAAGLRDPVADLEPTLRAIDANKDGIGLLGERFSGIFSTNDGNGPILRGLGFFEEFNPANVGFPGATGSRLRAAKRDAVAALLKACRTNPLACLARYLIPGLPGAVREASAPLGDPALARRAADLAIRRPARARLLGITPRGGQR